jgi:hypothetical protein
MPRYWFRQKDFGYGATPNTWQGWLFTIALALFVAALAFGADFVRTDGQRFLLIAIGLPVGLIPFILIGHAKTEGGWRWRWRWGRRDG